MPVETQLVELGSCNIRLKPEFSTADLLFSFEREQYENDPYHLLLIMMGSELEREPFPFLSNDIWHFDTECIEGDGSYVRIAERMQTLAKGELPIEKMNDHVEMDSGEAWLSFEIGGQLQHWVPEVKDDWVDPKIFSKFIALLETQNSNRKYIYLDLKGQDCLIGCATEDEFRRLKKITGLKFEWLT